MTNLPMPEEERLALDASLQHARVDTLKEIIREAELFLGDQFKAALAADSRAMTLSSVFATLVTILTGASVTLTVAKIAIWPYELGVIAIIIGFLGGLRNSVNAARPVKFAYCGNSPENWVEDVKAGYTIQRSLAGMASLYAQDIRKNSLILEENQEYILSSYRWALGGILFAVMVEFIIGCGRLGAGGFS